MHFLKVKWVKFYFGLARIAKVINAISKPVKLIAILILVLLSSLAVFWSSAAIIPIVACIGGVFAFFGLLIEDEAAKDEKKQTPEIFVADVSIAKAKGRFGWWVLMLGIAIEIGVAFWSAYRDDWHIRQMEKAQQDADPRNQPISSIKADVSFFAAGTNVFSEDFLQSQSRRSEYDSLLGTEILFCNGIRGSAMGPVLEVVKFEPFFGRLGDVDGVFFNISFEPNNNLPLDGEIKILTKHNASVFQKYNILKINLEFLKEDVKVEKTECDLWVNGKVWPCDVTNEPPFGSCPEICFEAKYLPVVSTNE
jgi:hypothetical protein